MGRRHGNLYVLDTSSFSLNQQSICKGNFCNSVSLTQKNLWHCHLGHPSFVKIQSFRNQLNLKEGSDFDDSHCSTCHYAKQRRLPFTSSNNLSVVPFNLIHLDIWGPFHVPSKQGIRYFLTIVDDCTRFTWVYFLQSESDVQTIFYQFFSLIQTQFSTTIKTVRPDNAPELSFTEFF